MYAQALILLAIVLAAIAALGLLSVLAQRRPHAPHSVRHNYTAHAHERMQQRGVTADEVEHVLVAPSRSIPCPSQDSVRLEREINGRVVKVFVVAPWQVGEPATIKTVACNIHQAIPVPEGSIGRLIGHQGATIRGIETSTNTRLHVDRAKSLVHVSADDLGAMRAAIKEVNTVLGDGGQLAA